MWKIILKMLGLDCKTNHRFKASEVIMVNDCSTDKSGKIMDEYANKYKSHLNTLHKNSGAAGR